MSGGLDLQLTERDIRLMRDLALSHVLSRDQIIALGYFTTVTRVNTRLRELRGEGMIRTLQTPFYRQSLYVIGRKALPLLGDNISRLVANRGSSPRFLQHALCTTNVRIELFRKGAKYWRFEQQLYSCFTFANREFQIRPDGFVVLNGKRTAIEVDLGHVPYHKFSAKLKSYAAFAVSGECKGQWNCENFSLLVLTTNRHRACHLKRLAPNDCGFEFLCLTAEEFGVPFIGAWS